MVESTERPGVDPAGPAGEPVGESRQGPGGGTAGGTAGVGGQQPPRVLSILGHPVAGLLPLSFLSAGWVLLALQIVPWLRDQSARLLLAGERPSPAMILAMPPSLLLLTAVAAGLLLVGAAAFVVWVRSAGGTGPLCDRLLRRNEILAAIVLLASGAMTVALISRGDPIDAAKGHIARGWLWHEYLRAGTFPRWSDLWFGGAPVDQFGPPLSHLLQAVFGFLRFDPVLSAKELVWFCRMAGGVGFALLCARIHRDQRSGLLGGILYALAPAFHSAWMWEGRLPGVLVIGIIPWALLAAERIATGAGAVRSGAFLALLGGGMVLAQGEQARLAILLVGVFLLVRGLSTVATRGARAPSVAGILVGLLGGAALAACFLYPMVREAEFLNGPAPASMLAFRFHAPTLAAATEALRWNLSGRSYIGISIALLAALGLLRSTFDRKEEGRGIGPIPIAILIVVPWIIAATWLQDLDLVLLGGQIAAAGAVRRGLRASRYPFLRKGVLPLAFIIVLVDLAPINLLSTYTLRPPAREQTFSLLEDRLGSGRFLELAVSPEGTTSVQSAYAVDRPIASVSGPSLLETPRAFIHTAAMIDTVSAALSRQRHLDRGLIDLLAFHDVRYVVLAARRGGKLPSDNVPEGLVLDPEIPALRIEHATPVTVLEPGTETGPSTPAVRFDSAVFPPAVPPGLAREAVEWLKVARPRYVMEARSVVLPNRLEVELPDLGPVTIRIARNGYPRTAVLVDGQPWPWREGPLGGIVIDLQKGAHRIEVHGTEDRIRRGCRYAQMGLAAMLFLLAISPHRR
jgi:hypothetical protein